MEKITNYGSVQRVLSRGEKQFFKDLAEILDPDNKSDIKSERVIKYRETLEELRSEDQDQIREHINI